MLEKITKWFMSTDSRTMFDTYISYFPTIGKSMKKLRGTKVRVNDNKTAESEQSNSWLELDAVYKQVNKDDSPVVQELPKIWTYGSVTRYKELLRYFQSVYGDRGYINGAFTKAGWVYYIDHNGCFCATSNDLVIDLLENSKEWTKYELPPLKKFTKAQIAAMIGMDENEFEIA